MADYNLGTARGTIEIDYRGSGASQATRGLGQVQQQATTSDEAIRKTGTGFLVAGAAIAGGLGVAIKSAADFEKGLSGIQAVSGASTSEMEQVRKKALQLGADTAFSASDASMAIEELVKAGISIPDVMNGAADATVALAAAGGVELPQAATIASNAMNQFGLSAKELPGIADKIAGAANASAIDVADLGQSMSQVGAVAHLAGLSFDDTALAITAMGNAGIKGSDAGTSLKTMLMNLQPSTKAAREEMKSLGIITKDGANQFYDASGKIKPMNQIAGVLQKSLKGLSAAQKQQALQTMFGSDAIRAAAVVADTGAKGMDGLSASINKVKAADVAATRMGNLSGQVEQLKGSAETLGIQLGTVLIPALNNIVGAITGVVNWFTSLDSGTQKAIVITAAFVGGLLLFLGALVKIAMAIKAFQATMLALNTTFLAMPITWIIIGIIALIAAIVLLWKNSETFRNIVTGVWNAVKAAVAAVANWFTGTLVPWIQGVWNSIVAGATSLWNSITSIWNSIVTAISTAWNAVTSVTSSVWNAIVAFFTTIWTAITTAISTALNFVVSIVTTGLNFLLGIWNAIWGLFGPLVMAVWDLIKAIIEVAFAWIKLFITTYLNIIMAVWSAIWNAIVAVVTTVWNAISAVVSTVVGVIKSVISTAWNWIKSVITTVMGAIRSVVSSVWNAISGVVRSVMSAISSTISSVWNAISSRVSSVVNSIKSTVSSVFNAVKSVVTSIWSSIQNIIGDKIQAAKDKVTSVVDSIKSFFSGAGGWLVDAGRKLIQGLIDGIKAMIGKVTGLISGLADKIRGFLPGSPIKEGPLRDHGWNQGRPGKQLVSLLAGGIESDIGRISQAFSGLEPTLPSTLTGSAAASRLVPVSAPLQAAPATPAPVQAGDTYFDVTIPVEDLAEIKTVQDFFDTAQRRGRQRTGVGR